jgi:cytochrome P450 family 619
MPTRKAYIKLAEWAKQYGDMYSIKIGSTTTIVLSNRALCKEVLERRNSISSGRPPAYALSELVYRGDFLLLMHPADPRYRLSRKLLHQFFGDAAIDKGHMKIINAEAAQFLRDLMLDPDSFPEHAQRYANSFIMSTSECIPNDEGDFRLT